MVSHDDTVDFVTTGSGSISGMTESQFLALDVDEETWMGAEYPGTQTISFSEVLGQYSQNQLLIPEAKEDTTGADVADAVVAAGVPAGRAVVQSFDIAELADPKAKGLPVMLLRHPADPANVSEAQTAGVDYVCPSVESSLSKFQTWVSSGIPTFAYVIDRRSDRDLWLGRGLAGFFSNDVEYVSSDQPVATQDDFASGKWMAGMIPAVVADASRPTVVERGRVFPDGYWGWNTITGGSGNRSFVLQGWACPIKGDAAANDFKVEFTANINQMEDDGRFVAIFLADEAESDKAYGDVYGKYLNGVSVLWNARGEIRVYTVTHSGATLVDTNDTGPALQFGEDNRFAVVVTPTGVSGQRLSASGDVEYELSTSIVHKGGYFHIGRSGLAVKIKGITVS